MPINVSGTTITFNDATTQVTAAVRTQASHQLFTSSGSWTCPTGVTKVKATVIGGGGGGAAKLSADCGNFVEGAGGGTGGLAIGYYTVVPGTAYTITVGAGGVGYNTGAAGSGQTSSFASFCSATGGGGGNNNGLVGGGGIGSNGTLGNGRMSVQSGTFAGFTGRTGGTSDTVSWAAASNCVPGAAGSGQLPSGGFGTGGMSGVVLLEFVS